MSEQEGSYMDVKGGREEAAKPPEGGGSAEKGYLRIENDPERAGGSPEPDPPEPEERGSAAGYLEVSASGNKKFNSETIGNNPYIPYLSIDTQSEQTEGIILIQNTPEIQSVLSQIQIIKRAAPVLKTINDAVEAAIGLIIPSAE